MNGRWQLIAGERRLRAAQLAGLSTIPAVEYLGVASDALTALVENIQRQDLNAIEESLAYHKLTEQLDLTQEQVAILVGKSRSHVTQVMALRNLPQPVALRVASGVLSAGHARVLVRVKDPVACELLAKRVVEEGISVRALEEVVFLGNLPGAEAGHGKPRRSRSGKSVSQESFLEASRLIADQLESRLDTKVRVAGTQQRGRIVVEFSGLADFLRIAESLNCKVEGPSADAEGPS